MPAVKPVLVIGSLNMDLVARCEHLPRAGQTVFGTDFFTAAGGKGANQAVAAARLGARVAMAGCVGDDQFGMTWLPGCGAMAVLLDAVRTVPRPTGTALITIDAAGRQYDRGDLRRQRWPVTRRWWIARWRCAAAPGILLLQHEIPEEVNAHAIRAAHAAGWFVVLNPAPARPVLPELLPLIDLIAPNETEAAALTGSSDPHAAARHLLAQGARAALITLGGAGALYRDASNALHCAAVAVRPVDTTAAGDAYIGALAAALSEDRTVADSLGFAAAAAGLAVTRLGAQPSLGSRDEVAAFIARFGAPRPETIAA